MTIEELRKIIDEYKDKIVIKGKLPSQLKINKILLQKYKCVFSTVGEMIYLVKNYDNLEDLHIFCYCGNKNNFIRLKHGYTKYCSIKCSGRSKEAKEKQKITMRNNIDENGLNGYDRAVIKQKLYKLNDIDENGLNSYQRTTLKIINIRKNDIDENGLNSYQRANKKSANTMLNTIDENGLNIYQQIAHKSMIKKVNNIINGLNGIQRANLKSIETKKKNHSFNKSQPEDEVYNYLLQKFNKDDIERQYKSNLYPFACDFYIKNLDLYIECHFSQFHNCKPFKNSIEDLQKLYKLQKKNTRYYKNIIYTWTDLDIRKLNTFKKNKLNYKIFYSIKQFLNWFNKLIIRISC